ncbi:MAG: hypothetical protein AAGI63_12660, partial [Planctomycetota bacterium]
ALLKDHPDQNRYLALQARSLEVLSRHQRRVGSIEQAEDNLKKAIDHYQSVIAAAPDLRVYATYQATALESMADLKLQQKQTEAARRYLMRSVNLLRSRPNAPPASPLARMQLQRVRQKLDRIAPAGSNRN